ncbi:MAG: hypothetical protein MJE77_12715 [Proteobacteria bacterium]|nr:hypothetical protein [Pseudomonadota bacterium]
MSCKSMTGHNIARQTIDNPVATLRATRQRVSTLHGQIRTRSDTRVIGELSREVRQLGELLPALIAVGGTGKAVTKAQLFVWPHDLNAGRDDAGSWGRDPAEVSRG